MLKLSGAALSAALLTLTFTSAPANAAIQIAVSDNGGTSFTDVSGFLGVAGGSFTFSDGSGITISVPTGIGAPLSSGLTLSAPELAIDGKAGDNLIIELTDNGYTSPTGPAILTDQLSTTDALGVATFGLTGYEDNTDHLYATTSSSPTGTLDSAANAAQPLSITGQGTANGTSGPFTFTSPYSLTEIANITFNSAGNVQAGFTAQLAGAAVPEPMSVLLFGTVLAGTGIFLRKRAQGHS